MARVVIPGFRKIEVSGGGEGGTTNYNELDNKPSINNVPLVGNLNTANLKLTDATLTEEGVPAEAKTVGAKLEEQSSNLNSEISRAKETEETLKSRIDNITSLPEGSTTGDAELQDIRVKADGAIATSAGNAVREQFSELKGDLGELEITFDNTFIGASISNENGAIITGSNEWSCIREYIPVRNGFKVKFTGNVYNYAGGIIGYDKNKNYIKCISTIQNEWVEINDESISFVRVSSIINNCKCTIKMNLSGNDNILSDDISYIKSMICFDEDVTGELESGCLNNTTGEEFDSANSVRTNFIEVHEGSEYYIDYIGYYDYGGVIGYDKDKKYVKCISKSTGNAVDFKLNADRNIKYIRVATYSETERLFELQVKEKYNSINVYKNIANPKDKIDGSVWLSPTNTYSSDEYSRTSINVKPNTTYTCGRGLSTDFSFFTNSNNENLGRITSNIFTTPDGCNCIKISRYGTENFIVLDTAFNGEFTDYSDFPYNVKKINRVSDEQCKHIAEHVVDRKVKNTEMTTMAIFESWGAIGDSFTSGGVYGKDGATSGDHYNISYPQIIGRRNGISVFNYSKSGNTIKDFLSDTTRGLPKLLSDDAKQLYTIMLGINEGNTVVGTISDIHQDYNENPDTYYGNLGRAIAMIISHAPKSKIVIIKPPITLFDINDANQKVAEHFGIAYFDITQDEFMGSDFYSKYYTGHPVSITYGGMALAFERQMNLCIQNFGDYFSTFTG